MSTKPSLGPVKAWSYSSLTQFEKCPHSIKLKVVDKEPQPVRDANNPMERGNRVHQAAEEYVVGQRTDLVSELKPLSAHMLALRDLHKKGKVSCEEEWAYDRDLQPVGWRDPDVWLRLKLDAHVVLSTGENAVIDYKTGKLFGNEVKHMQQGQLYAGIAALRMPDVQKTTVEFWYPDVNEVTQTSYTRRQAGIFLARFIDRAEAMTTAIKFPAKPSDQNCRFCDYGANKGTGVCRFDVNRKR